MVLLSYNKFNSVLSDLGQENTKLIHEKMLILE